MVEIFTSHIFKRSLGGNSVTIGLVIMFCSDDKAFEGAAAYQDAWHGPCMGKKRMVVFLLAYISSNELSK